MKKLGECLSDKELEDMMKQADIDGDGRINYEGTVLSLMVSHHQFYASCRPNSLVGSVPDLKTGGQWYDSRLGQYSFR